jgi:Uma2 family endonuclease
VSDVAFYRRLPDESDRKHALVAADLSIEILSPGQNRFAQCEKCYWYLAVGSKQALLNDPEERIVELFGGEISRYRNGDVLPLDDVLPGLELSPAKIFARLV